MKVNEGNPDLIEYSKKLNNRLRNETIKKEGEIKDLNALYEKKIDAAKIEGEDKYVQTIARNDDLIKSASSEYEEKLNSYKDNLGKTQSSLAQEELALKDDHQQKITNSKQQFSDNLHEQYRNATANQEDVNAQVKNSLQTISDKAMAERRHVEVSAKNEVDALASDYNSKSASQERQFRAQLSADQNEKKQSLKDQQTELKTYADQSTAKNKRMVSEKLNIQKEELNYLDNHQRDTLSQKQTDFKVRYENLVKEHNDLLGELKSHFEVDVKKMVEENATKKRVIANKADDSFYKVETLTPKITENPKELLVSLNVPEHEKENVHLSVHGRGIKMTLTRRFSDTFDEADGSTNRSTKNELFSREFKCVDILNPKLVDQKYDNGVLSYRIQKL